MATGPDRRSAGRPSVMVRFGRPENAKGPKRQFRWSFVRGVVTRSFLPLWFSIDAVLTLYHFAVNNHLGIDILIYRQAAVAALMGDNPWAVQATGYAFAGPPPSLLAYLPAALLPLPIATVLMIGLGLVAATWAVRRLELPLWWLLFPPLFGALIVGNPDALVLPLLLCRGRLSGLAAVLKVYAVVPLVLQRRWAPLLVAATVSLLSLPFLPAFIANIGTIEQVLDEGTADLSAWGTWLALPVLVALIDLRRRGAEWVVVPALWPNSQGHYGAMSLPVVHAYPVAAALIGLNIPLAPPLAVIAMALQARVEAWRADGDPRRRRGALAEDDHGLTRSVE